MFNRRILVIAIGALLLAWCGAAVAAEVSYMGYSEWGGNWSDAEKQYSRWSECSVMCWAATASNQIQYTGWKPNTSLDDADEIFRYFQDNWSNVGGWVQYGWNWWINGVNPGQGDPVVAQVTNPNSGNFYGQYNPTNFYEMLDSSQNTENLMAAVERNLKAGNGVGLWIYGPSSHAISCWGIKINDTYAVGDHRRYLGLYISDSDDNVYQEPAPDVMYYTPVVDEGGTVWWGLSEYRGGGYDLVGIQALERPETTFKVSSGSWGTASNWDNAAPDTVLETRVDGGTATIGANVNVGRVYVGFKGTGVVTQSGNTFTATELHLGYRTGSDGKFEIGNATLTVGKIYVGESGTGRFNITNSGATVNISKLLQFGTTANYSAVSGTTLKFGNDTAFKNAATNYTNVAGISETTFLFNGTGSSSINLFEVAGQDLGAVVSGFTNNFHIKALTVGGTGTASVKLVNDYVNYSGTEALYIHTLTVNSGSTFNLNNYHVYVGALNNYGTILNGTVTVVAGGQGNGPEMIPEPAAIMLLLPALAGMGFLIRRKR